MSSSLRSSSLASLPVANSSSSNIDSKDSVDRPSGPGVVPGGSRGVPATESDRLAIVLERLVDRVEQLEASQARSSRSVRDRPPTPALAAAVPASLSLSGAASGPNSMAAYLSSGAQRVPSVLVRTTRETSTTVDSDSEDESPVAPTVSSTVKEHPLYAPMAPSIIQDVGRDGFQTWMRTQASKEEWNKLRNRNECEVLAQVLDALVLDQDTEAAIEILVRRFVGVKHADLSGNWHFADVLAKDMPKRTLLRPSVLSCVLREAKNLTLLENGGYRSTGYARSDRGREDGRGSDRNFGRDSRATGRGGSARGGRFAQSNSGGGARSQSNTNSNSNSASSSSASASGGSSQGAGRGGNGQ